MTRKGTKLDVDSQQARPMVAETDLTKDGAPDPIVQAVLDACPDCIFVTDSNGTVLQANQSAAESLDTKIEELPGRSIHDLVPAVAADLLQDLCRAALETGEPVLKDEERDGRFYETLIKPQVSGDETLLTIYIRNITKRRQA